MDLYSVLITLVCIYLYSKSGALVAAAVRLSSRTAVAAKVASSAVFSGAVSCLKSVMRFIMLFCYFLWRVIKAPCTWLVALATMFVPDRRLERIVLSERPSEVVRGDLIFKDGKFYTKVNMGDYDLLVKMNGSSLFALSKQCGVEEDTRESMMMGSRQMDVARFPVGQVALLDGERVVGLGVRCVMNGREGLLTAAHVLTALKGASEPRISSMHNDGKGVLAYPFLEKWTLSNYSRSLDLAMVDVPADVFSKLGVGMAKLARLPGGNSPITVTRYSPKGFVQAAGKIVKTSMVFEHSASTLNGTSGAPVFWNGKVVGIHIRGEATRNFGVALDLFLGKRESDVRDSALTESDYVVDGDRYDVYADGYVRTVTAKSNIFAFSDNFEEKVRQEGRMLWADVDFDSDSDNELESGHVETEEVVTVLTAVEETPVVVEAVISDVEEPKTQVEVKPVVAEPVVEKKAVKPDFRSARVRGSPPTSASTNGTSKKVSLSKKKRAVSALPKSASPASASAPAKPAKIALVKAYVPKSTACKSTVGQGKTPKQSTLPSKSMPTVSSSGSNPVNKPSKSLLSPSTPTTLQSESIQARIVASAVSSLSNSRLAVKRRAQRLQKASEKKSEAKSS